MSLSADDLESAVLAYLTEHPRAMDTLGGIAQWWVERQRIRVEVTALSSALSRLVERGVLQKVGVGENPLYRLAQQPVDSATH